MRFSMRSSAVTLTLFPLISSLVYADPHYVQALHPYWGDDAQYALYLEKFTSDVDHDVRRSFDGDDAVYIYEYSTD